MSSIYDPAFIRKEYKAYWRSGEIPGSIILGKTRNLGCYWPGQGGLWYAARPDHASNVAYPSFPDEDGARAYILAPYVQKIAYREDARYKAWIEAAPKREARAAKAKVAEDRRSKKLKKFDKIFRVLDADGNEIGRVVRETESGASLAAASLLGYCKLPDGYSVEEVLSK